MKTLRKTLSLTLVFALVFSLMSFAFADTTATTTKTTGYTDAASITYKEAVDVTTAIGVFQGNDSGAFAPKDNLTREQAAKVICYLTMGKAAADKLTTASAPFTDVPAARWSAGSVAYCKQQGIIAGYGDGKFGPTDTVTGYQFAKMLLVALGYDATIEGFNGNDWSINVAKRAFANKLFSGNSAFVGTNNVTREESALYTFNMINKVNVTYSTKGTEIKLPDGTTIRQGASAPSQDAANGTYRSTHFPSLICATNSSDSYGRPAVTWKYSTAKIGTYVEDTPIAKWTDDHTDTANDTTVSKALSGYTFAAAADSTLVVNGVPSTGTAFTASSIAAMTGNGKVVEVYTDANDVINRVVTITTTLAKCINKDTVNKTIMLQDLDGNTVTLSATSDTDMFGAAYTAFYSMMSVGDAAVVVEQTGSGAITSILSYSVPTVVTGVYSAKSGSGNTVKFTVGGKDYQSGAGTVYSSTAHASIPMITAMTAGMTLGTTYRLVLDSYGYVKGFDTNVTSSATYAYLLAGSKDGTAMAGYTYNAKLLFADGTTKWVKMASYNTLSTEAGLQGGVDAANAADKAKTFVSYTANSDGTYALTSVAAVSNDAGATITNGSTSVGDGLASSSTAFLVYNATADTYKPYTGISAVPTLTAAKYNALAVNGVYKMVVVYSSAATSADVVYIYNTTPTASTYVNSTTTVNTYKAIVNGVLSTVKAKSGVVSAAGMNVGSTYTDDYITTLGGITNVETIASNNNVALNLNWRTTNKAVASMALSGTDVALTDGILTVANGTGVVSGMVGSNFVCYTVSGTTVTVQSLTSTATKLTGTLYLVLDSNGYIAYAILA